MVKKILYSLAAISFIVFLTITVIAYGRGFRINPKQKTISTTGVLSATSSPGAASVFIDGKFISATNGSFALPPGWYNLRIAKEGYQSWEKRIKIQGEVVSQADALLIPQNPSLRALTVSGVLAPALSPTGAKVAYIVPKEEATTGGSLKPKIGVWSIDLKSGPLGGINDPKQIFVPAEKYDWVNSRLFWSPDEKQILLVTKKKDGKLEKITSVIQIDIDNPGNPALAVTSSFDSILKNWQDLKAQKQNQLFSATPLPLFEFFKASAAQITFSPDNQKILYLATSSATIGTIITPPIIGSNPSQEVRTVTADNYYVYDLKEDKNFFIAGQKSIASLPVWYPDSKRIVMIENISIDIIDYDGTNKRTVYAGPFAENLVYPWTETGKLVILTNLNKPQSLPNLYEVDIR